MTEPLTLERLNSADEAGFVALLDGIYEHSPWIAARAASRRPFATLAQLKRALVETLAEASREERLALLRAHPELAGKAMIAKAMTAESTHEQGKAGLTQCTAAEFETLQRLNAAYNEKFGFPFMLAVRGPRGDGLGKQQIIATFARRLENHPDFEFEEGLRNVHRVAELRLDDRFAWEPVLGRQAWDCAELLAQHSDPGFAENGQLTVTYLTDAHRACAAQLVRWMKECGFDEVEIDAVGNVVGVYREDPHPSPLPQAGEGGTHPRPRHGGEGRGEGAAAKRLLTGSHFDTVRNGGKYDGRLGIFVPLVCVRELHRAGRRLPFAIEVVGFAEEEGQRYKATFLGSGALIGKFDSRWLEQEDADGITMREAMRHAGLPGTPRAIDRLKRKPADYLGFVEVHIEQGPVLTDLGLPLGVVTSINGGVRFAGEVRGMASHAGTTPMAMRRDAAAAVAELALFLEKRAAEEPNLVGTMGMLEVPGGSTNVIPGRCRFSLDIRATTDAVRDDCVADVLAELHDICQKRGVSVSVEETMRVAASPSAPAWQARWERAVAAAGLPVHRMPSGAGHDAMKLGEAMPQAMLFVRGENSGISHNPLESSTADDMQLAVEAFLHLLDQLAAETGEASA
ncbi:MAG: 2-oxo-4-hydroxy-4-carboxy-5-ureidoimidazoline decarboxylase [Burkholderiales bacterium]|nr:2-oxo-4-hydroxy-4-carboxy-5-ureidoimidazoline decarboxylase [Burkholderiales bacterium]